MLRFIDEATVEVIAGRGGRGCVSFRREKYVPLGGPDGGDGGKGGAVILKTSRQLTDLGILRNRKKLKAESGQNGGKSDRTGANGKDLIISLPIGTTIIDNFGNTIFDLNKPKSSLIVCSGGRGGKGNAYFKTSTLQTPKFAQSGEEGESRTIKLQLKLIADIGIVGFPNAGKSSLISMISCAKPKISNYPFTTLIPVLGIVKTKSGQSVTVADIPGLIRGAHNGKGLGFKFLKHTERSKAILYLLDGEKLLEPLSRQNNDKDKMSELSMELINKQYETLINEIKLYNPKILEKPKSIIINKSDLFHFEMKKSIINAMKKLDIKVAAFISCHSKENLNKVTEVMDYLIEPKKHETYLPNEL